MKGIRVPTCDYENGYEYRNSGTGDDGDYKTIAYCQVTSEVVHHRHVSENSSRCLVLYHLHSGVPAGVFQIPIVMRQTFTRILKAKKVYFRTIYENQT